MQTNPATRTPPELPRSQWASHPNYPSQVLVLKDFSLKPLQIKTFFGWYDTFRLFIEFLFQAHDTVIFPLAEKYYYNQGPISALNRKVFKQSVYGLIAEILKTQQAMSGPLNRAAFLSFHDLVFSLSRKLLEYFTLVELELP